VPYSASNYECRALQVDPDDPPTLYRAAEVDGGGFHGRTGIYELIAVDDTMRAMIHDGVSEQALEQHARISSQSIRADGRRRVLDGTTTLEEVLRVTRAD
jgi:general secretion pathway protein E